MAYSWYRTSKGIPEDLEFDLRMQACLLLCETNTPQTKQFLPADWQAASAGNVQERINFLRDNGVAPDIDKLASFAAQLSDGIERNDWLLSMLEQPRLFIRVRKRKEEIIRLLQQNELSYQELAESCMALQNGAPIDKMLPADTYVVQDYSSQKTGTYFEPRASELWWDCCSGAGGKSLLLKDIEPGVKLTVSDKRASILHNLQERFKLYKHGLPEIISADVTDSCGLQDKLAGKQFDNIICDVPCTGSGTWARTPEQLYFFKQEYINEFSERQKQIATNVLSYLKPGGRLIYITCSIFGEENEEVVDHHLSRNDLRLESQELINGIEKEADTMFVAVLRKP
jgi:16S rRNA (cytosine967-C5)-methyltransferase